MARPKGLRHPGRTRSSVKLKFVNVQFADLENVVADYCLLTDEHTTALCAKAPEAAHAGLLPDHVVT